MSALHLGSTRACGLATLFACVAVSLRAQDPPKVDWDSAAASVLVKLLQDGHVVMPAAESQKKLTIAVIGDDRFGRAVAALAAGRKTPRPVEAPFVVVSIAEKDVLERKEEWSRCNVVVFATSEPKVQTQALAIMSGRKALLVGRASGFVAAGGHLQLWLSDDKKPRFELDHRAALKLGIKLSSAVVQASKQEPVGDDK